MQASRQRAEVLRQQAQEPSGELDPMDEYEVAVWAIGLCVVRVEATLPELTEAMLNSSGQRAGVVATSSAAEPRSHLPRTRDVPFLLVCGEGLLERCSCAYRIA